MNRCVNNALSSSNYSYYMCGIKGRGNRESICWWNAFKNIRIMRVTLSALPVEEWGWLWIWICWNAIVNGHKVNRWQLWLVDCLPNWCIFEWIAHYSFISDTISNCISLDFNFNADYGEFTGIKTQRNLMKFSHNFPRKTIGNVQSKFWSEFE